MICPRCGKELKSDETLWTWQGKWYCTEVCVREQQKTLWGPRP